MRFNLSRVMMWVLQVVLALMVPLFIFDGSYARAGAALIAIFFSWLPALVKHNYKVTMPWLFEFFITVLLLTHLLGLHFNFYAAFWWWDVVAHVLGTAVIGALGFYGVYALQLAGKIQVSVRLMAIFALFFAIAIGALWEIAEFATDALVGANNQPSLQDTIYDLISDSVAALLIAIAGAFYAKKEPEERWREELTRHLQHIEHRRL